MLLSNPECLDWVQLRLEAILLDSSMHLRSSYPDCSYMCCMFTCAHAACRYCFRRHLCVRDSVRLSVRTKCRKLLIENWCNLVRICLMVNTRSVSTLVTFDLDLWPWELFLYFLNSGWVFEIQLHFQFEDTSSEYLGHSSVLRSWYKVKVTAANFVFSQFKLWVLNGLS